MALKVFDLACAAGHVFEGWFASREDYDTQRERGLLQCPVCDSREVSRQASAARLNVSGAREPRQAEPAQHAELSQAQAEVLRQMRRALRAAENVGPRFAEEARRMHEGDAPERMIRGTASQAESRALLEEGIAVMPVPDILDDDRLQ
ncbi:DUF1178 family protein [Verticiella sediminum]|uniref:DUF1178 family protein n=1 Tax=Verticiella sediminum TaxID=1247510 RepID=A0A556AZK4_9BURK|nr:DUF1178 family protein [Verticiella sediminum]TSH98371.1 DUF1178 family protein [Verticiella sediminum]